MAYENRQYLIIPTSELPNVDFSVVMETSAETVRKSVDQTKTFVKWQGAAPGFTTTMSGTEGPYTHSEIITILAGDEWTSSVEEGTT